MSVLDPINILYAFLIFVRIGGLMVSAPFFEQSFIPVQVKVFLSALIAYSLIGIVPQPDQPDVLHPVALLVFVLIEFLTGVVIGLAARFIFFAIRFAGEFIGFQMALSISQVISPADGQASNPISNILTMTFLMVFLLLDGHHQLFEALMASFNVIPLAKGVIANSGNLMLTWTGQLFIIAVRLAAPFMVTIFLVDMTLGIFARVAPQTEIFSQSLSLKLIVGVGLVYLYIGNFFPLIPSLLTQMTDHILDMIEAIMPV